MKGVGGSIWCQGVQGGWVGLSWESDGKEWVVEWKEKRKNGRGRVAG